MSSVIGYHQCSLRCGLCGSNHISYTLTDDAVIARCWDAHMSRGEVGAGDRSLMQSGTCPACGMTRDGAA